MAEKKFSLSRWAIGSAWTVNIFATTIVLLPKVHIFSIHIIEPGNFCPSVLNHIPIFKLITVTAISSASNYDLGLICSSLHKGKKPNSLTWAVDTPEVMWPCQKQVCYTMGLPWTSDVHITVLWEWLHIKNWITCALNCGVELYIPRQNWCAIAPYSAAFIGI